MTKYVSCSVMSNSVTPWTVAHQAPLSMEFSRQEYWGELPFPSPGDLPNPVDEPRSPALQADSSQSEPSGKPLFDQKKVSHLVMSDCLWPMDSSPPDSSVHGILQARILEWVAISFFRGSFQPRDRTQVSCIAGGLFTNWATREA